MSKEIAGNKKAFFEYEITDRFEAGIVLTGQEIKSIRAGKVNLTGSHAKIMQLANSHQLSANSRKLKAESQPELYIINMHIESKDSDPLLRQGYGGQATRTRKLLMHRTEISKLIGKTQQKGLTLIPLRLYLKNGKAKIELGLGRGKKLHDKRETIKKRDVDRSQKRGEE